MKDEFKLRILKKWIYDDNSIRTTYDTMVSNEKDLIDIYSDEGSKDLDFVRTLLYRLVLRDSAYLEKYIDFLSKHSKLNESDLNIYKKICFANVIIKREAPIDKTYSEELAKAYIKKYNDIKISYDYPREFMPEVIELGKKSFVLEGYEKLWKNKAVKMKDKANKLEKKYKYDKALEIQLKCFEKYGDIESAERIGKLYEYKRNYELALKYLKIAVDHGRKDALSRYESIINSENYKININLAKKYEGDNEEAKYLLEAFKYNSSTELAIKICQILLHPSNKNADLKLVKKLLDYYLRFENANDLEYFREFASSYAKLYCRGIDGVKNIELSCVCAKAVKFLSDELDKMIKDELNRTYEIIKERVERDCSIFGKDSRENKALDNIYDLGNDSNDFDYYQRSGESEYDFRKKLEYFKEALESKDEGIIVDRLKKAAKLGHARAMVALYYYNLKSNNIDSAYYYIFEAQRFMDKYNLKEQVINSIPVNFKALFKCFDKHNQWYCKDFILEHLNLNDILDDKVLEDMINYADKGNKTFKICLYEYYSNFDKLKAIEVLDNLKESKDLDYKNFVSTHVNFTDSLSTEVLEKVEYYASNGNIVFKEWLYAYYNKYDESKVLDELYDLAISVKNEYVILLIEAKGGFNPEFDERFVKFIMNGGLYNNKYVLYLRALLHSKKDLCEKYNLEYSDKKVFQYLYAANECSYLKVEGLEEKVKVWLSDCYEYGIGTEMDLEAASKLYAKDGSVALGYFNKGCLKEMYAMDNFHAIKDYFVHKIKVMDYPKTFEEIKRFMNAGFSLDEIFSRDGEYLGKNMINKLVMKEQEIERARLEKIRLEQERIERERLEKIRLEQERLEKERLEKIKLEQERLERERAKKLEEQRKAQESINIKQSQVAQSNNDNVKIDQVKTNISASSTSSSKSNPVNISSPRFYCAVPDDNKFYLELEPDPSERINNHEKKAIASLRTYFNYPPKPVNTHPRGKVDKQYMLALGRRDNEIKNYALRIAEMDNPIHKYGYNNYRRKVWELDENTKILTAGKFAELIEKEFNRVSNLGTISVKVSNYKFKDRTKETNNEIYLVERMLAHVPTYAYRINFNIKVKANYTRSSQSDYFDVTRRIEDLYDNNKLSRTETYELYDNMREELDEALTNDIRRDEEAKYSAILKTQKAVEIFVKNLFDQYAVFAGKNIYIGEKTQYIEGKVISYRIYFD